MHAWTVRVEESPNLDWQIVLSMVRKEQRLCATLALVVARPVPDGIDVPPV